MLSQSRELNTGDELIKGSEDGDDSALDISKVSIVLVSILNWYLVLFKI